MQVSVTVSISFWVSMFCTCNSWKSTKQNKKTSKASDMPFPVEPLLTGWSAVSWQLWFNIWPHSESHHAAVDLNCVGGNALFCACLCVKVIPALCLSSPGCSPVTFLGLPTNITRDKTFMCGTLLLQRFYSPGLANFPWRVAAMVPLK